MILHQKKKKKKKNENENKIIQTQIVWLARALSLCFLKEVWYAQFTEIHRSLLREVE